MPSLSGVAKSPGVFPPIDDLPSANIPLVGDEFVAVSQDGIVKKVDVQDFLIIPVETVTTSSTIAYDQFQKRVLFNPTADITITLPQQSTITTLPGQYFWYENISQYTVTFIKEGSDGLNGNTIAAAEATGVVFRDSSTVWSIFGGTAIVTEHGVATINLSITTSQTKILWNVGANVTFLGIAFQAFSIGTAGTFKLQRNGADITGLTGLVPATSSTSADPSTAVNLFPGDVITIVTDGSAVLIADLNIAPRLTVTY